ncbi:raffinose/stachyose/melibiose transport system substrate-binding protein [Sulfitobacter marinus]|uniref:Raffinose/stachyose/melibiose transport system substrate-binding protein n=1 Tax=Sulfitobacter marinus TaxID=394264 RepID=A0A1I6V3N3_9RHOB|nr:extracellular solute-binding protein [Sulfitobacter marinus]SFT08298.1 raffinose/stachyose/melibiose transport system substrate-binding protein [Sulfitobacter marinus]
MKATTLLKGSAAALLLCGTSLSAEELTIWTINYTSDRQVSALTAAEAEFEALMPGVDVEIVMRGTDEHKTALRVAAGSDTGPDIYAYWAGLGLGGEYVQAGLSTDLSPYYESYGWSDRLTAPSQAFSESFAEGKHGIPFRFSGEAVYYNKELFAKAGIESEPQTYEELKEAAVALKAAGIPAFTFGGTVNWHVMRLMDVILETTCGVDKHDALMAMELDWATEPCALEAFTEMKWWTDDHFLKPFMGIDNRQSTTLWFANRAAMMLEGDWHVPTIDENADMENFGLFPFPTGTGRLYGFAEYMYVSTKSDQADLAAKFLDMFTSDEFQTAHLGAFGALSVNKNVKQGDDALALHREWLEVFAQAEGTFVNGDQAFPLDVTTEYFRVINELASGDLEPQAAADAMAGFISNH